MATDLTTATAEMFERNEEVAPLVKERTMGLEKALEHLCIERPVT